MNYRKKDKSRAAKSRHNAKLGNQNKPKQRAKKQRVSTVDPNQLIKKPVAQVAPVAVFEAKMAYEEMALHPNLKANLYAKGFQKPTQIQEETLSHALKGNDIIGIANTGTGKTGAFLIPIIHRLLIQKKPFKTLVVVPTRELALQVEEEFNSLTEDLGYHAACFIGGTSVNKDLGLLKKRMHLIIGTPGRLLDLSNRGALRFNEFSTLILDEFDRMLDMGFKHDIMRMVDLMDRRTQTMLFSATIDKSQSTLIKQIVHNPIEVKVSTGLSSSDQVEQDIIRVPQGGDKFAMMLDMMQQDDFEKVILFTETKRLADRISKKLNKSGVPADQIHGNKSQNYRNNALNRFKDGTVRVLVATDVAARGIDVSDVSHVINYQLPKDFSSYVHRIGRTGRAGKGGKAFTFVD